MLRNDTGHFAATPSTLQVPAVMGAQSGIKIATTLLIHDNAVNDVEEPAGGSLDKVEEHK